MGFQVAFESENVFAQSNVSRYSSRWMEQQQKKLDGPVRCVCEERRVSECRKSTEPTWCMGLYQRAVIHWSGCGLHLVSQYSQFIGDPLPHRKPV